MLSSSSEAFLLGYYHLIALKLLLAIIRLLIIIMFQLFRQLETDSSENEIEIPDNIADCNAEALKEKSKLLSCRLIPGCKLELGFELEKTRLFCRTQTRKNIFSEFELDKNSLSSSSSLKSNLKIKKLSDTNIFC